jgi:aryl-alcohol dehydrogenase-like predicted oxidoreductase
MGCGFSRRRFLQTCSLAAVSAGIGKVDRSFALPDAAVREFRRGGMVYRRLGGTDLYVSLLSYGSHTDPEYAQKGGKWMVLTEEGQARRDRQIARALDLGVNMIDTYETAGQWEPVARLIRPRRDKVLVSLLSHQTLQVPLFVGDEIDEAVKLYGHVDMYRINVGEGNKVDDHTLEDWDILRKAKETGKVRALGISTHTEAKMMSALQELDGLDYVMFPYNFIHARAGYSQFLPAAIQKGIGLIAIKPLAAGSIVTLDPRARHGSTKPQSAQVELYESKSGRFARGPILPAVVADLTKSLNRLPDETLCQAALRFLYSKPFMTSVMPGMFDDYMVDENYQALSRYAELSRDEASALTAAKNLAEIHGRGWLPPSYRWLDERWRA